MQYKKRLDKVSWNLSFEFTPYAYKSPTKDGFYSGALLIIRHDYKTDFDYVDGKMDRGFYSCYMVNPADYDLYATKAEAFEAARVNLVIFENPLFFLEYISTIDLQKRILEIEGLYELLEQYENGEIEFPAEILRPPLDIALEDIPKNFKP